MTTLAQFSVPMLPDYAALPEALRDGARRDGAAIDAVYFHVPFCSTKCHYCDFYSIAGHLDQADAYLAALQRELILQGEFFGRPRPRTIFVGGGTPTLLEPVQLEQLFALIRRHVDLSALREFTVEANPNTFTAEKAVVLAGAGVNRISCGAQSFNRAELSTLQRDHDPASVAPAFEYARRAGIHNLSLDLIFGIPGQTPASWEFSLASALALAPSHISCYSLTYEPNTAMTARLQRGEFAAMDEETELELFNHVHARLHAAGFARYEISNYGRVESADGREGVVRACAHNLAYWKSRNWLAFGPSGGAHVALPQAQGADAPRTWQWKNAGSLAHYLEALQPDAPRLPITQMEILTQRQWAAAAAIFWLRLSEGLNFAEFQQHIGVDVRDRLSAALAYYADMQLVEVTDAHARLLEKGVPVSNRILAAAHGAL